MSKSIQFTFNDGTKQVLNPTNAFFANKEYRMDYTGKRPVKKLLSLEDKCAEMAYDLGANGFKLIS